MKPECPYFKRSFWDKILFDNKEKDIVYSANILGKGGVTVEQKLKAIEKCIDKYMRNTCRNCTYKKRTGCDKNVCFENQVKILEIIKGTSL